MLIFSIYIIMNKNIILLISLVISVVVVVVINTIKYKVELFQAPTLSRPRLITVYTEWCGYSKRFISDDIRYQPQIQQRSDANVPERTYVINNKVYSNKTDEGVLKSDWELLKNSLSNVDTELIDFDKLSEQEKNFYSSKGVDGFPTVLLLYNGEYIKYTEDVRTADLIINWINSITNINEIYNLEKYLTTISKYNKDIFVL
jgi:thiol-disulfide isomerase/thioredoxin